MKPEKGIVFPALRELQALVGASLSFTAANSCAELSRPLPRGRTQRKHVGETGLRINPRDAREPSGGYHPLQKWAAGQFDSDWDPALTDPADIEKRRIQILDEEVPDTLTRTALEACAGGAFFPGIEVGRVIKKSTLYAEPMRLNLAAIGPGDLTLGNALPWQADFYACAYDAHDRIGWWPAQRPDDVFPQATPTTQKAWDDGINSETWFNSGTRRGSCGRLLPAGRSNIWRPSGFCPTVSAALD